MDPDDPIYVSYYFRVANKYRTKVKEPMKILDFLGDLGGLLDISLAFGALLTFHYVKKRFYQNLVEHTYQIQKYAHNNSEYYIS